MVKRIVINSFIMLSFLASTKGQEDSLLVRQNDSLLNAYKNGMLYRLFQMDREEKFMIKAGNELAVSSPVLMENTQGALFVGLDLKLRPSLSVENLLFYSPSRSRSVSVSLSSSIKYYYDIRKRIFEGRSANNFSADYIKFSIQQSFVRDLDLFDWNPDPPHNKYTDWRYEPALMIGYGIQRRLWPYTFMDFSVSSRYNFAKVEFELVILSLKFGFGLSKITKHE